MFSRYLYHSGINEPYVRHCGDLWRALAHLNPAHVIDIGGNDGTLLATFQSLASRRLQLTNVDASASFIDENRIKGIDYVNAYWGTVEVEPADIIVSTNVFQHNQDLNTFLRGIKAALRPQGLWVLEFPYFLRTAETLQFDQFYHEHVYYWLLTPLIAILAVLEEGRQAQRQHALRHLHQGYECVTRIRIPSLNGFSQCFRDASGIMLCHHDLNIAI